jgi:alanyl-tRNA synthetase
MLSQQVRQKFIAYFKDKGHTPVPSSSVIPHEDPTLLFTNAGMNQFKDVFLGHAARDYKRAVSSQKCIRVGGKHNDLENVGHTSRHLTFFEMLGNFSFGDYFKKEAIAYAWEVSTQIFGFDPEFLWATVFEKDDEAFELWKAYLPDHRIVRMGEKDNFWAMGDTGPCGPCSELYFDKGERYGKGRNPSEDTSGERFLEFWNLVFMQYNRQANGQMDLLPKQSVDTGSGLERVISLMMGVDSLFATDVLRSLIGKVESLSGTFYKGEAGYHVIADHIRSLSFAIADGAVPSNLDRGYVLRKLIRRATRYARALGIQKPFLAELVPTLVEHMGTDYPELKICSPMIQEILTQEEESFLRTLKRGGNLLNQVIAQSMSSQLISGQDAFVLKDTYGLPLDEILLIAKDAHLAVDIPAYEALELEAKERSRGARAVTEQVAKTSLYETFAKQHPDCEFVGYTHSSCQATILGIIHNDHWVESLESGQEGIILLNQTPFYAEKGGQVGDAGSLSSEQAFFEVTDCQSPFGKIIAHKGIQRGGLLEIGQQVQAQIDMTRRLEIARHHSATHLLHYALGQVLGAHVKQAGSIVEPTRLRFDFHHPKALTPDQIDQVEAIVNQKIRDNHAIASYELSYQEAQNRTDIKQLFGEKYGHHVRVIDIDFSKELCGGTHANRTGDIGYFKISKEGSISSGVRRIEAVCGKQAELLVKSQEHTFQHVIKALNAQPGQILERLKALQDENQELQNKLSKERKRALQGLAKDLLSAKKTHKGQSYLAAKTNLEPTEIKDLIDVLNSVDPHLFIILINQCEGKAGFVAKASKEALSHHLHAGELIAHIAPTLGGKGGGKPEMAQGSGPVASHIDKALDQAETWILSKLS